jgi:GNAT superfamily N-acetyltransferase
VTTSDVEIRPATTADVRELLALWQRADAAPSVTDTAEDLARIVGLTHACVLLAHNADAAVVGSIIATFDGWRGNIYRMAVDPTHRRRGLALRLVAAAEDWLRGAGAKRVSALVLGERPEAQSFWAAAGYAPYAGMQRYVKTV